MSIKHGKKDRNLVSGADFPQFCDLSCTFASFGTPEVSGACRKELAIWCKKYKKYNNKNNKCVAIR